MWKFIRKISLTQWIIIAMATGAIIGFFFPEFSQNLKVISNVFLRLIKTIIIPILFGTLVVGIAGNGNDLKAVGRLAVKSIIYFEIVTSLALIIGLVAVSNTKPGVGVVLKSASVQTANDIKPIPMTFQGFVEHLVPRSFIESAANNDVLQVVVFFIIIRNSSFTSTGKTQRIYIKLL